MILRHTQQRAALRSALERAGRPLSPLELLAEAQNFLPELGQATVYRAIKSMLAEGVAVEVKVPGEPDRYEAAGKSHHHHFLCKSCDRLYEIEGCPGNLHQMAPAGFAVEGHELTLYGRCPDCRPTTAQKRRKKLNTAAVLLFILGFLLAPLLHQLETAHGHEHHDAAHCGLCQLAHLPALDNVPVLAPTPALVWIAAAMDPIPAPRPSRHHLLPYSCGPPA